MSSARYVYAITRRDTPLPTTISAAIAPRLAMISWRDLAAVTRRVADEGPHLTMQAVLHHEQVVEAVRKKGPALPVRFGTVFHSASSITSVLAERYERLAADLCRLGDKAELSLTALWARDEGREGRDEGCGVRNAGSGGRYLRARAAELQLEEALEERAHSFAEKLDEVLGELSLERRVSLVPTPRVAIRTSYLIEPAKAAAFRMAFDALRREQTELRMLLTGPWPPYSFAEPTREDRASADGRVMRLSQFLTDAMQERRG
jgi:hypothetical protein